MRDRLNLRADRARSAKAHQGEGELQRDHDNDRRGSLPTRLSRLFRQNFALVVHATILDLAPVTQFDEEL